MVSYMHGPLVSVKMITYNHEPYITQAIEGVLAQKTNFPFELVIGEDCSTDGTRGIVYDYQRKYPQIIQVVTSEKNVGSKKNSLRTQSACRGKYVGFCEGDDYWHREDKLQVQVDYIESHPDCGLVCSDYDLFYVKNGRRIKNFRKSSGKELIQFPTINDIIAGKANILTLTVLAKKDLIEKVIVADPYLFQEENFLMGDTQLWAEISLIEKIYRIEDSLATHNILEESATQSANITKRMRFWKSNQEMALYLCTKHNLPRDIRELHEKLLRRRTLKLAFFENSLDLANEVKKEYGYLSPKDNIWYLGTKYKSMRPFILFFLWIRSHSKKNHRKR